MNSSAHNRFCIIGAGPSGLAVAKNFLAAGIAFDCLEREDDVGGNWYYGRPASSVYESTHLISSKRLTEFVDFPMPEELPEYPSHRQALTYLRDYALHFKLHAHIRTNAGVERIEPQGDAAAQNGSPRGGWRVRLASGEERTYRGVVIANGHNWDPRWPEYPGEFTGTALHSAEYKTPDVLAGKRVLVVGGGNSGCDLAAEAAVHAREATLSLRRGYHVLPKYFKGIPIDQFGEFLLRWRFPRWSRRLAAALAVRWVLGPPETAQLPRPTHRLFEAHPVINSQLHHHIGHGRLRIKPEIARLAGEQVEFVDGSRGEFDVILYATGFRLSFEFVDREHLNWQENRPELLLNVFHPSRDDLFVAGMIQPDSGQWGLVDYQAQLIAAFVQAVDAEPACSVELKRRFAQATPRARGTLRYVDSPRHRLEVDHFVYRRELQRLLSQLQS